MSTLVGLLLLVGIIALDLGPNLRLLFDPLACVFVLVGTVGLTLASFPPSQLRQAAVTGIRAWFCNEPVSDLEGRAAVLLYTRVALYAQVMGWIGVIFGLVVMLEKGVFADPGAWQSGLRVCILTLVYGLFIAYAFCMPIRSRLEASLQEGK